MNEKKIILTEEQFEKALTFVALGAAGIMPHKEVDPRLNELPEGIRGSVLASSLAAAMVRENGPLGALMKTMQIVSKG